MSQPGYEARRRVWIARVSKVGYDREPRLATGRGFVVLYNIGSIGDQIAYLTGKERKGKERKGKERKGKSYLCWSG
jgi:hypothetical protein